MGEKVISNREQQKKYDRESNVDSSIYSRVNIGQGANNKFDSPNLTHSGGSMSNPDEKRKATYSPLSKTIIYYACGVIFTGTIALLGLQLFHDYFYGSGMNELFPSLILIFFSLVGGFSISKFLLKRINNKRKE